MNLGDLMQYQFPKVIGALASALTLAGPAGVLIEVQ
jgi:hypothetical protein